AATRVLPLAGDAAEDWQILVKLAQALGVSLNYPDSSQVRADIASRFPGVKTFEGIADLAFGTAMTARHWLQASNPSQRWKWDFMFQDRPPVKGEVELSSLPPAPVAVIPLKEVK